MKPKTDGTRVKLSATVSQETYQFLKQKVDSGAARKLGTALDASIAILRRLENRRHLAVATARHFAQISPKAAAEENALARAMASAATTLDFDKEF